MKHTTFLYHVITWCDSFISFHFRQFHFRHFVKLGSNNQPPSFEPLQIFFFSPFVELMHSPRRRDRRQGSISPRLRSRDRRGNSRVPAHDEEERRVRRRSRSRSPRERARSGSRSIYRRRSGSRSPRGAEGQRSRSRSSPSRQPRFTRNVVTRSSSPERSPSRKNSRIRSPSKTNYRSKERDFGESSRQLSDRDSKSSREKDEEPSEVVKPNFGLSGKLAAESNKFNGVALKYQEPPEARKPTKRWRLYVFKKDEQIGELEWIIKYIIRKEGKKNPTCKWVIMWNNWDSLLKFSESDLQRCSVYILPFNRLSSYPPTERLLTGPWQEGQPYSWIHSGTRD